MPAIWPSLVKQIREKHGVEINYVCPVNEPEWEADGTESCYATNTDIATIAKQVGGKFAEEGSPLRWLFLKRASTSMSTVLIGIISIRWIMVTRLVPSSGRP